MVVMSVGFGGQGEEKEDDERGKYKKEDGYGIHGLFWRMKKLAPCMHYVGFL